MTKTKWILTVGSCILFALLIALLVIEIKNPQGGVLLLQKIFG